MWIILALRAILEMSYEIERRSFIESLAEDPKDRTRQVVFADFLQENDEDTIAEFIRSTPDTWDVFFALGLHRRYSIPHPETDVATLNQWQLMVNDRIVGWMESPGRYDKPVRFTHLESGRHGNGGRPVQWVHILEKASSWNGRETHTLHVPVLDCLGGIRFQDHDWKEQYGSLVETAIYGSLDTAACEAEINRLAAMGFMVDAQINQWWVFPKSIPRIVHTSAFDVRRSYGWWNEEGGEGGDWIIGPMQIKVTADKGVNCSINLRARSSLGDKRT